MRSRSEFALGYLARIYPCRAGTRPAGVSSASWAHAGLRPPHRRRGPRRLLRRHRLATCSGDAVMVGCSKGAKCSPPTPRAAVVELGWWWPSGGVRLRALQLLALDDLATAVDRGKHARQRAALGRAGDGPQDDDMSQTLRQSPPSATTRFPSGAALTVRVSLDTGPCTQPPMLGHRHRHALLPPPLRAVTPVPREKGGSGRSRVGSRTPSRVSRPAPRGRLSRSRARPGMGRAGYGCSAQDRFRPSSSRQCAVPTLGSHDALDDRGARRGRKAGRR